MTLPPLTFRNADVLRPDGFDRAPLTFADGVIAEDAGGREVDLSGYLVLPGIVDLHGDGFERHLAPRRGALQSLDAGLEALDAELAQNGITTAVLAQFFSWEGGMRGPDYAEAVAEAVAGSAPRLLSDLRLQLRFEVNLVDDYNRALALIDRARIGFVVFNDHLPHDALAAGRRPPGLTGQALKSGRSPEVHLALIQDLHDRRAEVPAALAALAAELVRRGALIGSHDDHTPEDRARHRALGAHLAEFPETEAAARAAREAGDTVVMGAPNVVRGGSHGGKVSAGTLVAEGLVDALVSDYHYPAPRQAAFALADAGMDLAASWALISTGPADILGLADRGRIAPGLRADLVIVDAASRRVAGTVAGGRAAHFSGELAARLVGA